MSIDKKNIMFWVGLNCQEFRRTKTLYTQADVAKDLGYSVENVSAFENSRNDNMRILMWYILHGMDIDDLLRGLNNE